MVEAGAKKTRTQFFNLQIISDLIIMNKKSSNNDISFWSFSLSCSSFSVRFLELYAPFHLHYHLQLLPSYTDLTFLWATRLQSSQENVLVNKILSMSPQKTAIGPFFDIQLGRLTIFFFSLLFSFVTFELFP